jgi:caa(3)-type oxidase subunit IV
MTSVAQTEHHEHGPRFYWIVGFVLAVITILEVVVTIIGLPHELVIPLLMIMMVIKGAGVVMFFMHLRGDAGIMQFVFIVPFVLAVVMVLFFMLLFSTHVGIAG